MPSTNINVRVDSEVKKQADELFEELGLTMSSAINVFLKQCIREYRIPFDVKLNVPNAKTIAAIEEGRRLAKDPNAKKYDSMEEAWKDLMDED